MNPIARGAIGALPEHDCGNPISSAKQAVAAVEIAAVVNDRDGRAEESGTL